jgi:hypothetical protein
VTGFKHSCDALSAVSLAPLAGYPSLSRRGRRTPFFILPFSSSTFATQKWSGGAARAVTGLKHSCVALSAVSLAPLAGYPSLSRRGRRTPFFILPFSSSTFGSPSTNGDMSKNEQ